MAGTEITEVSGGADLETVRALCRAFRRGQYERYPHEFDRIDRYYREEDFERTLAALAETHAPPGGVILLARLRGQPAGCVMLACVDGQSCEMKRMFVEPAMRGYGVGRALGEALLAAAKARGYTRMRLDTGPLQHEAVALYRNLGFRPCAPYIEDGPNWPDKVFMDRDLNCV